MPQRFLPYPLDVSRFCGYWARDYDRSTPPPQPIDVMLNVNFFTKRVHNSIPGALVGFQGFWGVFWGGGCCWTGCWEWDEAAGSLWVVAVGGGGAAASTLCKLLCVMAECWCVVCA